MMAGRGSVKVCRSRSVAIVSKMPKRTWQLNYKSISKESCVSILGEVRGELPDPGTQHFRACLQLRNQPDFLLQRPQKSILVKLRCQLVLKLSMPRSVTERITKMTPPGPYNWHFRFSSQQSHSDGSM